jgi:hypothetical protein
LHKDGALPRRSALPMTHIAGGLAPNIAPSFCNADPWYFPDRFLAGTFATEAAFTSEKA